MVDVSLKRCESYDQDVVDQAVHGLLAPLGGMEAFVKPGQKVLIKPNLLMRRSPDRATTTHPAVLEAVVKEVQRVGGLPWIAESSGGPFLVPLLRGLYEGTGLSEMAKRTGVELDLRTGSAVLLAPRGVKVQRFDVLEALPEADVLISIGKLKTHSLTTLTGVVKNLFGLIPGTVKVDFHARFPERVDFAHMLVDLCEAAHPTLAILDAVFAMEGEGPSGGHPRKVEALIASANVHAVDEAAARLVGLEEEAVLTLAAAKDRGLLPDYRIMGEDLEGLRVADFDIPMAPAPGKTRIEKLTQGLRMLRPKPVFPHVRCNGCGVCTTNCPVGAIAMNGQKRPVVTLRKCIRCFCCQELCPQNDVLIKRHLVLRLLR